MHCSKECGHTLAGGSLTDQYQLAEALAYVRKLLQLTALPNIQGQTAEACYIGFPACTALMAEAFECCTDTPLSPTQNTVLTCLHSCSLV